jgi:RNA polymerase sigma-70 factor (sigma-E family)
LARLSIAHDWAWLGASPGFHWPSCSLVLGAISRCSSRQTCSRPRLGRLRALGVDTDRVDRAVGPDPEGQVHDRVHRVDLVEVDHFGAGGLGVLEPIGVTVHGDHPGRSAFERRADRELTHRSAAPDRRHLAIRDVGDDRTEVAVARGRPPASARGKQSTFVAVRASELVRGGGMTTDFADFVRLRYAELLRSAYLLSGSSHAAEDLLQTALLKAMGRWSTIEDPLPYLRRSMVNLHVSVWRRYGAREIQHAVLPERRIRGDADQVEQRHVIVDALRALPPRTRAVVVLRYWDDLSEADTAAALNCSIGTVKSQASRGLARLRVVLGERTMTS